MKLVIAGKGGAGKTSISGTMARSLARRDRTVLVIDGDSNPNLALTLGIPIGRGDRLPVLSPDLLPGYPDDDTLSVSLEEICRAYAVTGPDGVRLLVMAHPKHADTG